MPEGDTTLRKLTLGTAGGPSGPDWMAAAKVCQTATGADWHPASSTQDKPMVAVQTPRRMNDAGEQPCCNGPTRFASIMDCEVSPVGGFWQSHQDSRHKKAEPKLCLFDL